MYEKKLIASDLAFSEKRIVANIIGMTKEEIRENLIDFIDSISFPDFIKSKYFVTSLTCINNIYEDCKFIPRSDDQNVEDFDSRIHNICYSIIDDFSQNNNSSTEIKKMKNFIKDVEEIAKKAPTSSIKDRILTFNNIKNYYYWETYKNKIIYIDESEASYEDKLLMDVKPLVNDNSKDRAIIRISDISTDSLKRSNMTTGNVNLDNIVNFQPGNLAYIAARPSVGKSMFVLNCAIQNALKGQDSLYISLEMSNAQTLTRIFTWLKGGNITAEEIPSLKEQYKKELDIINEHFYILDAKTMSGPVIFNNMEKFLKDRVPKEAFVYDEETKEEYVTIGGVIYLDHIGLVRFPNMDEWESLREASRKGKQMARSYNGVVICCSLASRESETIGLTMSSLYGASTLEADADIIIGLDPKNKTSDAICDIDLKVLKNRDGIKDIDISSAMNKSSMHFD